MQYAVEQSIRKSQAHKSKSNGKLRNRKQASWAGNWQTAQNIQYLEAGKLGN